MTCFEPEFAFHAAPPPGQWLNDPNALAYHDGAYRLFAQHRDDGPAFKRTGWARFSSPDLLHWRFDGAVIPPDGGNWMYSGCIVEESDRLEALHSLHSAGLEHQVRRTSDDGGATWSGPEPISDLGAPGRNRRDPFVFRDGTGWALLLAEPCDWTEWRQEPASRLRLYRSTDRVGWRDAGVIGPWREPGIMWEVPVLVRIGGWDVLLVSEVDRRSNRADCSVRAWVGRLGEAGFTPAQGFPRSGQRVDQGPDFYALTVSGGAHWPLAEPAFVGWLSSWQTARTMSWPGFAGGPISIPRQILVATADDGNLRLKIRPAPTILEHFTTVMATPPRAGLASLRFEGEQLDLTLRSADAVVTIIADYAAGKLTVTRAAVPELSWARTNRFPTIAGGERALQLFVDGMAAELFLVSEGIAVSIAVPGAGGSLDVEAHVDGRPLALEWMTLPEVEDISVQPKARSASATAPSGPASAPRPGAQMKSRVS